MAAHLDFGQSAEHAAAALLERSGWTILARNWRFQHKEIDLVARRGEIVAFVEVRARASSLHGHPLETIGWRKRRRLQAAAQAWVARHGVPGDVYRFDVVTLLTEGRDGTAAVAEHLEDAWRL